MKKLFGNEKNAAVNRDTEYEEDWDRTQEEAGEYAEQEAYQEEDSGSYTGEEAVEYIGQEVYYEAEEMSECVEDIQSYESGEAFGEYIEQEAYFETEEMPEYLEEEYLEGQEEYIGQEIEYMESEGEYYVSEELPEFAEGDGQIYVPQEAAGEYGNPEEFGQYQNPEEEPEEFGQYQNPEEEPEEFGQYQNPEEEPEEFGRYQNPKEEPEEFDQYHNVEEEPEEFGRYHYVEEEPERFDQYGDLGEESDSLEEYQNRVSEFGQYQEVEEEPEEFGEYIEPEEEYEERQKDPEYDEEVPRQKRVFCQEDAHEDLPTGRKRIKPAERESRDSGGGKPEVMDKVLLAAGVGILILLLVTVGIFINKRTAQNQVAAFANVGLQLEGIQLIGERGLQAVAEAEKAKVLAAKPTDGPTDPKKDYGEVDYDRQVSVEPDFTSIQKDLKIKFINKNSDKLVANVPFSVTVVGPDGKSYIWSDDDMDGIIYKKDIAPGTYQVAMETLTDSRYSDYSVMTSIKTVEVKKEIVYEKVNVTNEIKKETEINAAKEDTKIKDTVVESVLQDTVAWVESKVISSTYNEVAKAAIPDPVTLVRGDDRGWGETFGKDVLLLSEVSLPTEGEEASSVVSTEPPTPIPEETPSTAPTEAPTPVPTEVPTQAPTQAPAKGTIVVNEAALWGSTGSSIKAKAVSAGFSEGRKIVYTVRTEHPSVATATVDENGNIQVYGVAVGTTVLTVTANYENGSGETEAATQVNVTIGGIMSMTLDVSTLTTFVGTPVTINANIANALSQDPTVTAESSDSNIVQVSVNKRAVTVTGAAEGNGVITVKYVENGQEVSATCTVTVKTNPRQDRTTMLKDGTGRQLFVMEGNVYREATYADYYVAEKFFVKGEAKYTGWQTLEGKVYYFTADGNKVTGEQVIQGAKYNFASDGSLVTGDGTLGIDVSKWNGNIDWNAVKNSGVSFVIIRCGYRGSAAGKLIEDPKYVSNIKGATAAGLKVGVYFFSQAVNEIEAVEEASMVLEQIKGYQISYPVFLDVEASGGRGDKIDRATRTAVCKAFCQTIQSAGYTAGVYSNKVWLDGKIDAASLNSYKIWLAQYAANPTYTGRYDMWQYKPSGSISGISGNVDMNISYLGY